MAFKLCKSLCLYAVVLCVLAHHAQGQAEEETSTTVSSANAADCQIASGLPSALGPLFSNCSLPATPPSPAADLKLCVVDADCTTYADHNATLSCTIGTCAAGNCTNVGPASKNASAYCPFSPGGKAYKGPCQTASDCSTSHLLYDQFGNVCNPPRCLITAPALGTVTGRAADDQSGVCKYLPSTPIGNETQACAAALAYINNNK